jgi:peptidyl-prolyl cis-trans isomerase C
MTDNARFAIRPPAPARFAGALGLAACFLLLAAPAHSQEPDPVVARVNGTEIHASDVAIAEEEIGPGMQPMAPDAHRDYIITYLTDTVLVAQAAEKEKLDQSADFKRRMAVTRNRLLSEALLTKEAKAGITDAAMHKVYDEAIAKMGKEQEVHARHILVPTEAEAKEIEAQLKKGADFATLAKEKSKDPGAAEGGDLGYFTKDQMVPEFAEVAFKLAPGTISDPVKTQFGWHIIKVEDKRDKPVPTFDKVKDQIEGVLQRKGQTEMVAKLRAGAKIERLDAKPATPAAPAPGAGGAVPK